MYYNQNYNAYPQSYPNGIYGSSFNPPMQPQVRSEIVKVNGENGARAYQLAPNSSALLLDISIHALVKRATRLYNSVMRKIDEIE